MSDPWTVLRDRIASKIYERAGSSLNASDWLHPHDAERLADAVMELFVDVRPSPWLRAGYAIAQLTERDSDWMCGAYQPVKRNPYRCTEPHDHAGAHLAAVDGAIAAQWSRSTESETPA